MTSYMDDKDRICVEYVWKEIMHEGRKELDRLCMKEGTRHTDSCE